MSKVEISTGQETSLIRLLLAFCDWFCIVGEDIQSIYKEEKKQWDIINT